MSSQGNDKHDEERGEDFEWEEPIGEWVETDDGMFYYVDPDENQRVDSVNISPERRKKLDYTPGKHPEPGEDGFEDPLGYFDFDRD